MTFVPFDGAQVTSAGTLRTHPRPGSNSETVVTHTLTGEGHDASEDGTGRGTPLVPMDAAVRRLTPVECERLQGYPDGWTATSWGRLQADGPRYRQMGNSVAVPCVEWIVRRLLSAQEARTAGGHYF